MAMETTKARREAAILFVAVFVLGVVFGGVGDRLWNQHVSGEPITIVTASHPTNDQLIDNFSQAVQLTPEQRKQLAAIMDDTEAKWRALYAPLNGQKEAIRQEGRARIRAILTPEQVPKFEAYMKRVDEQRKAQQAAAAAANKSTH
jgi:Spy/CpxP family protein refolding chaperone